MRTVNVHNYTEYIQRLFLSKIFKKKCKFFQNTQQNSRVRTMNIHVLVSKLKLMFMFRLIPITYENFRKTMNAESAKFCEV